MDRSSQHPARIQMDFCGNLLDSQKSVDENLCENGFLAGWQTALNQQINNNYNNYNK